MTNKQVEEVCKIGQGNDCCRYLLAGSEGFECGKLTELKSVLDKRVTENTIIAQGDNCEGIKSKM